jgi:hypothetical protein
MCTNNSGFNFNTSENDDDVDPVNAHDPVATVKSMRLPSGAGVTKNPTSPATIAEFVVRCGRVMP